MRAMSARGFTGYQDLKLVELPKPEASGGKVLVRMTAAGVTPLEHTILSGQYSRAKAPLVLGGEGAGFVEEGGGTEFPVGSRVMFTGPYGVTEDGTYSEWLAVRKRHLSLIPDCIDEVHAAWLPVAYLTAQMSLSLAVFQPGKTVLAAAIGGSIGNAVTQLARALGAKHAISSTTNPAKAKQAKALGFEEVIDLSSENLRTECALFAQPPAAWAEAWKTIVPLLRSGAVKPIVAKTFPLAEASNALRYLVEDRPFGRVVLTI